MKVLYHKSYSPVFGKVDPTGGDNCFNMDVLKDTCNKAARKKGIIPENGCLNQYPVCQFITFSLDDVVGESHTRVTDFRSDQIL